MKEEYNYTLTVPITDIGEAQELLQLVEARYPQVRISRKPDRRDAARFYLCFPFAGSRTDHGFTEWLGEEGKEGWDLFGPNYGVWGLS